MTEYRLEYCRCPHVQHYWQVMFIKAASADDAKAIARDHIERKLGWEWFSIRNVAPSKPVPMGEVVA